MSANKKYRDSVFTMLFSEKQKLIELYNAIEGTNYTEDADLVITTLEDVLYMNKKNDVSFTIGGKYVVLLEHQSSINENMPLRFLIYIARVYEKLIDNKAIYKERMIKIPTPEFVVLYNGAKDFPKEKELRLSDAFLACGIDNINLELTVRVININYGKSPDVLEKSRTLKEYSYFVYLVNQNKENGMDLEEAIENAIKRCLEEDKLSQFLKSHGSEVINMLFTEFNMEDALKAREEEGREEGLEEGLKKGLEKGLEKGKEEERYKIAVSLFGILDDKTISEKTGLPLEEIIRLKNQ